MAFKRGYSSKPKDRGAVKFAEKRGGSFRSGRPDSRGPSRSGGRFNRGGDRGGFRPTPSQVTCDSCGTQCEVPFRPTAGKPVYCNDCFKKDGGPKTNNDLAEINEKLDKIMHALEIF